MANGASKLFNTFHMYLTCLYGDLTVTLNNTIFMLLSYPLCQQCVVLFCDRTLWKVNYDYVNLEIF